jgi:hypothetical protein
MRESPDLGSDAFSRLTQHQYKNGDRMKGRVKTHVSVSSLSRLVTSTFASDGCRNPCASLRYSAFFPFSMSPTSGPIHCTKTSRALSSTAGLRRNGQSHECVLDLVVFEVLAEIFGTRFAASCEFDCVAADIIEQQPCTARCFGAEESVLGFFQIGSVVDCKTHVGSLALV